MDTGMSVNWPVFLLWAQLFASVIGFGLIVAWFATGRKHKYLQVLGGIFVAIMCALIVLNMRH